MLPPTGSGAHDPHPYHSPEQRRASIYRALLKSPQDKRLRGLLLEMTTPHQIRQAAKSGIFINYSRADELFALDLATDLRSARHAPWLDMLDVPPGCDWRTEVQAALNRCGLMLTIATPETASSRDLRAERHYFMSSGKIVIPLLYGHRVASDVYLPGLDFRYSYALGLQTLLRVLSPATAGVE